MRMEEYDCRCSRTCGACSSRCLAVHQTLPPHLDYFSFFKLMEGNFTEFLEIPWKLASGMEEEFAEARGSAILMGRNGQKWATKICVGDGRLARLTNGWENFVSDHSLCAGDVVVFIRVANTFFLVQTFGSTGNEKQSFREQNQECVHENRKGENSLQIVNVVGREKKRIAAEEEDVHENRKGENSLQIVNVVGREKKRIAAKEEDEACNPARVKSGFRKAGLELKRTKTTKVSDLSVICTTKQRMLKRTWETEKALIKTENDFSGKRLVHQVSSLIATENPNFGKVLTDSAVRGNCRLSIPRSFGDKWLKEKYEVRLIGHDAYSRIWLVKIQSYDRYYGFGSGWTSFVRDHRLKKGDACVFELVDIKYTIFKVHIIKLQEPRLLEM